MARIAYVSPMPPADTGIASYSAALVAALGESPHWREHELDAVWPIGPDAEDRVREADVAVYHMGNNAEFHRDVWALADRYPGVVVLHDVALDDLVRALVRLGDPLGTSAYREARASAGRLPRIAELPEPMRIPWCAQVVRKARAVVVHSEFGRRYLESMGCRTPIHIAPHPLVETEDALARAQEQGRALRDALRRDARVPFDVLVGVLGDLSGAKGIDDILDALPHISAPVHLLLVGRTASGWDVAAAAGKPKWRDRVTLKPDVSDDEFLAWLTTSDIVVNLRHPHRGEVSGSLVRAFQAARPTIVSAIGTYLEWPSDSVIRVSVGEQSTEELAAALSVLALNPAMRTSIGERAREYAAEHLAPEKTAAVYAQAVSETLALQGDPVRGAISRWAAGLGESGVTPEMIREGLGARFAEELAAVAAPETPATS